MMDTGTTISLLSDSDLDEVAGGKHSTASGGGTVVNVVEISIGEIVAAGGSAIILEVSGGGSISNTKASSGGHKKH